MGSGGEGFHNSIMRRQSSRIGSQSSNTAQLPLRSAPAAVLQCGPIGVLLDTQFYLFQPRRITMSRVVSLVLLVVIILLASGLFFMVMSQFLLPMFLAVLLVVLFRPVHREILRRSGGRPHVAAGLTTTLIVVIVLVPLLLLIGRSISEGVHVVQNMDREGLQQELLQKRGAFFEEARHFAAKFGMAVPKDEEIIHNLVSTVESWIAPAALRTTQFLGSFLLGFAIMLISLYFFLADGPGMVDALMRLSPLEDRYEQQLLDEFAGVSRAVVLATLLSAVTQGVLAGVGYLAMGIPHVFLLTFLTMLLALVPFVGATAIWLPCCLWLYFLEDRAVAAVLLAVWGVFAVSMVDNLIKPFVLHGQSNIHPLLALLSVWGGIQTLGPIGIFVGPMVVAFLQALLNILRAELDSTQSKLGPTTTAPPAG